MRRVWGCAAAATLVAGVISFGTSQAAFAADCGMSVTYSAVGPFSCAVPAKAGHLVVALVGAGGGGGGGAGATSDGQGGGGGGGGGGAAATTCGVTVHPGEQVTMVVGGGGSGGGGAVAQSGPGAGGDGGNGGIGGSSSFTLGSTAIAVALG